MGPNVGPQRSNKALLPPGSLTHPYQFFAVSISDRRAKAFFSLRPRDAYSLNSLNHPFDFFWSDRTVVRMNYSVSDFPYQLKLGHECKIHDPECTKIRYQLTSSSFSSP